MAYPLEEIDRFLVAALVKRLTAKIFGSAPVEGTVRCLTIGG